MNTSIFGDYVCFFFAGFMFMLSHFNRCFPNILFETCSARASFYHSSLSRWGSMDAIGLGGLVVWSYDFAHRWAESIQGYSFPMTLPLHWKRLAMRPLGTCYALGFSGAPNSLPVNNSRMGASYRMMQPNKKRYAIRVPNSRVVTAVFHHGRPSPRHQNGGSGRSFQVLFAYV